MDYTLLMMLVFFGGVTFYFFRYAESFRDKAINIRITARTLDVQHRMLKEHFEYYEQLSDKDKKLFLKRVNQFMARKKFIGREEFEITPNVKLLISAAAIQVTFGQEQYTLPRFKTILIYPDRYLNKRTNQYHHGEVNPKGLIVLSWKRFLKGYEDNNDKINLGLHEMAHAFLLTVMMTNQHDANLDEFLQNIVQLSKDERSKINNNDTHFLRDYAKTNIHEFFAVAIEHFFEAPQEFKEELPQLYKYLCLIIKQDPANGVARGINYTEFFERDMDIRYVHREGLSYKSKSFGRMMMNLPETFFGMIIFGSAYLSIRGTTDYIFTDPFAYIGAFLVLYWGLFRKITLIRLYKSYIEIKAPFRFFFKKLMIPFPNIISFEQGRKIELVYVHSGKVFRSRFSSFDLPSNEDLLMSKLRQQHIVTIKKKIHWTNTNVRAGFRPF